MWRDTICALTPERPQRDLHFRKLNHGQKLAAVRSLSGRPLRTISVLANKTLIPAGVYNYQNQLYFYQTRYLIERISWICRDYKGDHGGDGKCKIVFSRRGGMSYDDFREYLVRLQDDPTVSIHWPCIDVDGIEARDHSTLAGLQLADAVATAFASGVEPDRYGICEPRYAEELKRVTYRRNLNFLSYGVKLIPSHGEMELSPDQQRFVNLFS